MRTTRQYSSELPRRIFRTEVTHCLSCGTRLRRASTVSRRIVVTQDGPVRVTHCGYRCFTATCPTAGRTYRSTLADTLALPGFTFGLDWVILVGHLRLAEHLSLDQTHSVVQERLAPWQLRISRREILYLFDAYCTLFRAAQEWSSTPPWRQELLAQGGVILAIDGIQPDKGNETIYMVRDVLTGRLLAAENLLASEARVLCEQLLAPLAAWDLPVLGVITDGQESLRQAVAATWPGVPHQVCQFHALREAGRLMYERDRAVKVHLRKAVQERIRVVRRQLEREVPADPHAAEQVRILAEYAAGIQALINRDGLQPFRFAALAMDEALGAVDQSLAALEKKEP
jgi:hypothetical protein